MRKTMKDDDFLNDLDDLQEVDYNSSDEGSGDLVDEFEKKN
jgi:hypothetical protein